MTMLIEKSFPSGALVISEIINDVLVTRRYFGYSKRDTIRQFRAELRAEREGK